MARNKTAKLSEREKAMVARAKELLMQKGTDALPEEIRGQYNEYTDGVVIEIGARLLIAHLRNEAEDD